MFLTHASCIALTLSRSFVGLEAGHITINDVGDSGSRTWTQMVSTLTSITEIVRCSPLKLDMRACNHPSTETVIKIQGKAFGNEAVMASVVFTMVIFIIIVVPPIRKGKNSLFQWIIHMSTRSCAVSKTLISLCISNPANILYMDTTEGEKVQIQPTFKQWLSKC